MNWDKYYRFSFLVQKETSIDCNYKKHSVEYAVPRKTLVMGVPYLSVNPVTGWSHYNKRTYITICNECLKEFVADLVSEIQ